MVNLYDYGLEYYKDAPNTPVKFPDSEIAQVCPEYVLKWFEYSRKGTPLEFIKEGEITYYTLFENRWHYTNHLKGKYAYRLYLSRAGLSENQGEAAT